MPSVSLIVQQPDYLGCQFHNMLIFVTRLCLSFEFPQRESATRAPTTQTESKQDEEQPAKEGCTPTESSGLPYHPKRAR